MTVCEKSRTLVIFGGRDDTNFKEPIFSDLHVFDIEIN